MKLLMKEWKLCMHPFGYIAPLLSVLVVVPGYPYGVCCFYMTMAIYFICLTGRENHDASYTLTLPVTRQEAVRARILFCTILETAQMIVMALFMLLKKAAADMPNPAGLDAGLAMIGEGFLIFALFSLSELMPRAATGTANELLETKHTAIRETYNFFKICFISVSLAFGSQLDLICDSVV